MNIDELIDRIECMNIINLNNNIIDIYYLNGMKVMKDLMDKNENDKLNELAEKMNENISCELNQKSNKRIADWYLDKVYKIQ